MPGRIVLFGATGYIGELTARALVSRGARPVLAARDAPRLETLAERLGRLDTAAADATRPDTVPALVEDGDVLVSTVGCHDGSSRVPDHPRLEAVTLREIACAT